MVDLHYIIQNLDTHLPSKTGKFRSVMVDSDGNVLCSGQCPVISGETPSLQPFFPPVSDITPPIFIGGSPEENWWVHQFTKNAPLPSAYQSLPLRTIAGSLSTDLLAILGRGVQLVRFDHITTFCGRCGTKNGMKVDELAKQCPACGLLTFPRLSPAIIVRIVQEDRILLARSPHFPSGMYSVVAGFVEPGESLEAGVHREVFEEVGIRIRDLQYFGSQPWPFPDSLMIGFVARYLSGEIKCDGVEIEDAQWFSRDQLPELPGPLSIARSLIEDYLTSPDKLLFDGQ
ncbi:MAG: NAD(+) diphosphatase [Methanospirillum sp.]|uniref:NAD(+) diphosphatase n=1 Tax=Methanospirillum sp. TaxID=45200 RepID=UPI00236C884D|nr:NAD(+) diphosphatase [Methanospirillum sp.]MDD1728050.1 NAD(+) diphosphatase [Methanospirillum sp.]